MSHIHGASRPPLTPLVLALLAAFPAEGFAQAAIARPPAPPAFAVPRPMPAWRVAGVGSAAPVNRPNASGGIDQSVSQLSQRAVYNWQSFDIGSASSVTFNFPSKDSSALNRVLGSPTPSQIFGTLTSRYPNPVAGKEALSGGSVYLINANGILFGRTAQVDVGALVASTLNLKDADFNSGLANSVLSSDASFRYEGAPELFTDARNFVRVDNGASITTASGGRVFLFAKNVQNAGSISTPGGQTVLAGGDEVFLKQPTAERLYASEVNPSFPALRGLLVEVGQGSGSAANLEGGTIATPRGNTTLVGMAVNQSGRISATTSVAENGSVLLLARGGAQGSTDDSINKHATRSGALTLGPGSRIEIAPDTLPGADGKPLTSDGNSTFTASRVELAGLTVELKPGAEIVAHGGVVDVRAEATPFYQANNDHSAPYDWSAFDDSPATRLVIGDGARIDVSGTTTASVSAARNFVTTELLGKSDLKDAPLQKDGPLYRSKVTFDVRQPVPILGDTGSYSNAIKRSAEEQLAHGGTISLVSSGVLVTHPQSTLDVSGGQVSYTDAVVAPTRLVAADGSAYTLAKAPKDIVYTGIEGASKGVVDRWGLVPTAGPSQAQIGIVEKGYVDGQAGGSLNLVAPRSLLDGELKAATVAGARQSGGLDAPAAEGRLTLGLRSNDGAFGTSAFMTAGLKDLVIGKDAGTLPATFWDAPLSAELPATSRIAASTLNASGVGQLSVTVDGGIVQQDGAGIALAPKASLNLAASGDAGIMLGAGFHSEGGGFTALTRDSVSAARPTVAGSITLRSGQAIDVAGDWVNRALDGAAAAAATAGGAVTLSAAQGLNLQDGSRIDVSGGATVSTAGSVKGTDAGSIALESNVALKEGQSPARIHIGADLKAQSMTGGGTLKLRADKVTIAAQPIPRGVKDGVTPGSLVLSDAFFRNGAFTGYDVQAVHTLQVQPGAVVAPQAANWLPAPNAAQVASGTRPSSFLDQGQLPDSQRKPASLSLSAAAPFASTPTGDLTLGAGATIRTDPLASVALFAGLNLDVEGSIQAPGGNVSITLRDLPNVGTADAPVKGSLRIGSAASIDVSGQAVLQVPTGLLPQGSVLAGGKVGIETSALGARLTPIEIADGAVIRADGASARLGVATVVPGGGTTLSERNVASTGGAISIVAREGGATLNGEMHAFGGAAGAAAGSFSLQLAGVRVAGEPPVNLIDNYTLVVQQAPVTHAEAVPGSVQVSAQSLRSGFADASLQSMDRIRFNGDVELLMPRRLQLDAPLITASPQSRSIALGAGSVLLLGSIPDTQIPTPATPLAGGTPLSLQAGLVELYGRQTYQGFSHIDVLAQSELRLHGAAEDAQQGRLSLQADLDIRAPLVVPTTGSQFTIDAPGQRVQIGGGDRNAAVPLSAAGAIVVNARDIRIGDVAGNASYGVLRAPAGSIALNASEQITIGEGSLLSVSGSGSSVPFGATVGGNDWTYAGRALTAPAAKTITLSAPGHAVDVKAGATLDLSGGGDLVALEFVAGPGGSRDIFAGAAGGAFAVIPGVQGYAPQDIDILALKDAAGTVGAQRLGRQISFGDGGPLPAGTYAVLPARYAVLPGAFLVQPASAAPAFELGTHSTRPDGSVLVGGKLGDVGAPFADALPQTFQVTSSTQAQRASEIRQTRASDYFAEHAPAADSAVPRLPIDAGRLDIVAGQLSLKGTTLFALSADTRSRGGELDLAAERIRIGDSQGAPSGVLSLSPADLNATGASLIVVGGVRGGAGGNELAVLASEVSVDNAGAPLKVSDLVLVGKDRVELKSGSRIESVSAAGAAQPLSVDGDGALLRISGDATASSVRTNAARAGGDLSIGPGVTLKAGAITAEGTHSTSVAADASLAAQSITLGASRIAAGEADADIVGATTLLLGPALASQLSAARSLTLRSFDGLDLYGPVALGGAALQALTIDTGSLRLVGDATRATIEAGGVRLVNSSGAASVALPGHAELDLRATGSAGGSGQVVIGPGSMALTGAARLRIDARNELLLSGTTDFSTGADIAVTAAALQAGARAAATLTTSGSFGLASIADVTPADGGLGAHLAIDAASIAQNGKLILPSGQLTLNAHDGGVQFGSASFTDLSGRTKTLDGITIATSGGALEATSSGGNVVLDASALIDVSSRQAGGRAGSVVIAAPAGTVTVAGDLRAVSAEGAGGGTLSIDSRGPLDLGALAAKIGAEAGNFGAAINVRNRDGDQRLPAGARLAAREIMLSSDAGSLAIAGTLDAQGSSPRIVLAAGETLRIEPGADVSARSSGPVGGEVQLLAGRVQARDDGSLVRNGQVLLDGGTIRTAAIGSGADGSVLLRAQRDAGDSDVRIARSADAAGTALVGVGQVEVEAVRQYRSDVVDAGLIARTADDNLTFAGADGANAARVRDRLGALLGTPATVQLRSGVEVISDGDMVVSGIKADGGWNLMRFDSSGNALAQASGAPINLTLRAAGDLHVAASLSDGFVPAGAVLPSTAAEASRIVPGAVVAKLDGAYAQGARIRLVGGADMGAADVMATVASTGAGDVVVGAAGKDVLVRSTTGEIRIAAGRDVQLLNHRAVVYTTGQPVDDHPGYVGERMPGAASAFLGSGGAMQSPFLAGAGNVDIRAAHDLVGATDSPPQFGTDWLWRARDLGSKGEPMWWARYDRFKQGFASFGGGKVSAHAGNDALNVEVSAGGAGYVARDADGNAVGVRRFGAGDLSLQAGRDVVGGFIVSTGGTLDVDSGRSIAAAADDAPALQLLYGNSRVRIGALNSVDLGAAIPFGFAPITKQTNPGKLATYVAGLAPDASLDVLASAGDLVYRAQATPPSGDAGTKPEPHFGAPIYMIPDRTALAAPQGSIVLGKLLQVPAGDVRLDVLAGQNIEASSITVAGTDTRASQPTWLDETHAGSLGNAFRSSDAALDLGERRPVHLVAGSGDLSITTGIDSATALRLVAGRDLVLGAGGTFDGVIGQHQSASELSLIVAGRDLLLRHTGDTNLDMKLHGPGELVVVAGRHVDLSDSGGIGALGNREAPALAEQSGRVTVLTGVSLGSADYRLAQAWYFPLLGGAGIAGFAPDLAAQLSAARGGLPLPPLGSAAAASFGALPIEQQIAQARQLAGDAGFDAALLAGVRLKNQRLDKPDTIADLAQAKAVFDGWPDADKFKVVAAALANAWTAVVPAAQQQAQALAMAGQGGEPSRAAALVDFVGVQTGHAPLGAAAALAAYQNLPAERQLLLTDQVLRSEVRQAGRAASVLSGAQRDAAYAHGYDAIDLVFPELGGTGDLKMGSSQIHTFQGSAIDVIAPRGGIDVGELSAGRSPKSASALGIVTAAGGDVSLLVRDSVNVNQSRVFTVGQGDLLMWASLGNLDAGRGAKTVTGAPPPVFRFDAQGNFVIDTSGSFSGSGIAVLDAGSTLDLYAPKGEINAGDAGIKSVGNAFLGAARFVGADNLSIGGVAVGAPPPASTGGETTGLAALGQAATAAVGKVSPDDSEEEKDRKRRKRLNLILDFIGFGDGSSKQ